MKLNSKISTLLHSQFKKNMQDSQRIFEEINKEMQEFKKLIEEKQNDTLRIVYNKFQNQLSQEKEKFLKLRAEIKQNEENINNSFKMEEEEEKVSPPKNNINKNQEERQKNINDIYQKTILVSDISKNINEIATMQEAKVESIESNIRSGKDNCEKATGELEVKHSKVKQEYSNNGKLAFYLIILIIVFSLLVYFTKH